jgi:L,D-peptidoglycan transpeptidase YkuD (ErfK/YbiS/YcfS/YnhG family)
MAATIDVSADGRLAFAGRHFRAALGRSGVTTAKREGDGATPAGILPLRRLYYRADRLAAPRTGLPATVIQPDDGWCDAPDDPAYNRRVTLPHAAGAERLWRADGLYDLVVELGWNDAPVRPGRGSAIFLHVARPDYGPTEGCVALAREDLLEVLAAADAATIMRISAQSL